MSNYSFNGRTALRHSPYLTCRTNIEDVTWIKDGVSQMDLWWWCVKKIKRWSKITVPAYRKWVDVVVVLDVKQHHRASGAPSMMVSLIPHKLQHIDITKSVGTFQNKSISSLKPAPCVHTVKLPCFVFTCRSKFQPCKQLLKQKPSCETYKYSLINMTVCFMNCNLRRHHVITPQHGTTTTCNPMLNFMENNIWALKSILEVEA